MTQIIIEDPEMYAVKDVDSSGRIYLGKEWAGREVRIAVESVREGCDTGNAKAVLATTAD